MDPFDRLAPTTRTSSREHLREQLLSAAAVLLGERGVSFGVDISLDDASSAAGVSRSSAYRVYSGRDAQARFRVDLLCFIAARLSSGDEDDVTRTLVAVAPVLESLGDIEAMTVDERRRGLATVICAGADENLRAILENKVWHLYANALTATQHGDGSAELEAAFTEGVGLASSRYGDFYRLMAATFGLQMREGYSYELFGSLAGALVEGVALRFRYMGELREARPPYLDGVVCTPYTVGFLGLVREFFAGALPEDEVDLEP